MQPILATNTKRQSGLSLTAFVLLCFLFTGAALGYLWLQLFRIQSYAYTDDAEHFKYASIGLESAVGVPYPIWKVMPQVCHKLLPHQGKDWSAFGAVQETGQELPIGFSKKGIGMDRVGLNCAACHVGTYRTSANGPQQIVLGAPPTTFDLQSYTRFLGECAQSVDFTPDNLIVAMQQRALLTLDQEWLYRLLVIPTTQKVLVESAKTFAWFDTRPDHGPGRVDTFGQAKYRVLMLPDDGTVGTVDFTPVWQQKLRDGQWEHWDGNNNSYFERNVAVSVAISGGKEIDTGSIGRVGQFLWELPAPKFPLPINADLALQGQSIYQQQCAACHAATGEQVAQVVDIQYIGTDPGRLNAFSQKLMDTISGLTENDTEYAKYYRSYRKTNGYLNVQLDGIWLRAPYLHNGSVPTLWDLLQAPKDRPAIFYRGSDLLDNEKVGFVSQGSAVEQTGFRYDTSLPGNHNAGHEYGTALPIEEKKALVEYLKRL